MQSESTDASATTEDTPPRYVLTAADAGKSCSDGKAPTESTEGGRRHRGLKAKTLRRMLKKAGLKVSGKKSTLTKRAKKAHLMRGGVDSFSSAARPSPAAFGTNMSGGGASFPSFAEPAPASGLASLKGGRRGVKAKTLKKLLKRAGLKTSGKKSTLRARAKKAHLVRGGNSAGTAETPGLV